MPSVSGRPLDANVCASRSRGAAAVPFGAAESGVKLVEAPPAEASGDAAALVVVAAAGYPDSPRTGDAVDGLDAAARLPGKVFHAGTKLEQGRVVTSGGRVLCAVGLGGSVADAQRQAYALVDAIRIDGAHWRRDIGYRAIARGA